MDAASFIHPAAQVAATAPAHSAARGPGPAAFAGHATAGPGAAAGPRLALATGQAGIEDIYSNTKQLDESYISSILSFSSLLQSVAPVVSADVAAQAPWPGRGPPAASAGPLRAGAEPVDPALTETASPWVGRGEMLPRHGSDLPRPQLGTPTAPGHPRADLSVHAAGGAAREALPLAAEQTWLRPLTRTEAPDQAAPGGPQAAATGPRPDISLPGQTLPAERFEQAGAVSVLARRTAAEVGAGAMSEDAAETGSGGKSGDAADAARVPQPTARERAAGKYAFTAAERAAPMHEFAVARPPGGSPQKTGMPTAEHSALVFENGLERAGRDARAQDRRIAADTLPTPLRAGHAAAPAPADAPVRTVATGAGSFGAAPLHTPADLQAMVGRQVGDRLIAMANKGDEVAHVRLHPAELGSLEIRVSMRDEGVMVAINAQHAHARELIEAGLPRLRDMFEAGGMSLLDVDVSGNDAGMRQRESMHGGEAQLPARPYASIAQADAAAPAAAGRAASSRLLDLLV